jgi:hypothetical protein
LHWDESAKRLGVRTSVPEHALDVLGDVRVRARGRFLADVNTSNVVSQPSYSWGDDTDTGIFRPIEDTIAFSTGAFERARLTAAGNFGVGTDAPLARFHVAGGDMALDGTLISGSMSAARITSGTLPVARGGTGAQVLNASKLMVGQGAFAGVISPAELHWNDVDRRLGIGTDTPQTALHVSGTVTAVSFIGDGSALTGLDVDNVNAGVLDVAHGGTGKAELEPNKLMVGSGSNQPVISPSALHWDDSNERLGVGTSNPVSTLDVDGTATALAFVGNGSKITDLNADNVGAGELNVVHGGTGTSNLTRHKLLVGRGSNEPVLLPSSLHWDDSNERLGVGTSNPSSTLDVNGIATAISFVGDGNALVNLDMANAGAGELAVERGGTGRSNLAEHKLLVGRGQDGVEYPDELHWDGLNRRLGVGTNVPSTELDVNGTVTAVSFVGDGNSISNLDMNSAGTGELDVERGGTGRGDLTRHKLLVGQGSDDELIY